MTDTEAALDFAADGKAFLDGAVRDALELDPDDLQIALALAGRDVERGAYPRALRTYATLTLCEPRNAEFQLGLANCAMRMEQYELGLQAATLAIAFAPADPRAWLVSGRCRVGLGRPADEARHDLAEAEELGLAARNAAIVGDARRLLAALPS